MRLLATLLTFLIPAAGYGVESAKSTLTVIVDGISTIEGQIRIKLLEDGQDPPVRKETAPVREATWTWVQKDIPHGKYSVKVFHDRNGNGELDTGFMGIPTEAYGFSNNARSLTGPPEIRDTLFDISEPEVFLKITIQ